MITGTLVLLGIASALFYYLVLRIPKWKKMPPGPPGVPVLGNLIELVTNVHQHISLVKWADIYGPIFKMDFAKLPMVVISDYKMVKELFNDTSYSGRMDTKQLDWILDGERHGVINTEGSHWEELRRFTLRQLRDFGFGKNSMEESIMIEVNELLEGFKKFDGKPLDNVKERLVLAVVNSLWGITTGKRFKQDDQELLQLTRMSNDAFNTIIFKAAITLPYPWLGKLFPGLTGYEKIPKIMKELTDFFGAPVKEHQATISPDYDRDFIDVFLKEIQASKDPNSAFNGEMGEKQLVSTLLDLYLAGTDTTSSSLAWLILYLSKMPEVQTKFQQEIESITGNTRPCQVADRPNMPYTEALIAELMRFSSLLPQAIQHKTLEDKEYQGYSLPKGTVIVANLYYIHHDPKIWGDPENFRPERFLSPDGKTFKKHPALMPFSVGRRQCLGETLARNSLFLFSTNLFQRFSMEFDKSGPNNGYEPDIHFLLTPKPYSVILKDRLA